MSPRLDKAVRALTFFTAVAASAGIVAVLYQQDERLDRLEAVTASSRVADNSMVGRPRRAVEGEISEVTFQIEGTATKGRQDAPVGVVVFSDFDCPFCRRFAREALPDIDESYVQPGKVVLAFKHFPLSSHPLAPTAAAAAICAQRQGGFWGMHDRLFMRTGEAASETSVVQWAARLGLAQDDFQSCLGGSEARTQIRDDVMEGERAGVTGTPAVFIGKRVGGSILATYRINGAVPVAQFRAALDRVLNSGG